MVERLGDSSPPYKLLPMSITLIPEISFHPSRLTFIDIYIYLYLSLWIADNRSENDPERNQTLNLLIYWQLSMNGVRGCQILYFKEWSDLDYLPRKREVGHKFCSIWISLHRSRKESRGSINRTLLGGLEVEKEGGTRPGSRKMSSGKFQGQEGQEKASDQLCPLHKLPPGRPGKNSETDFVPCVGGITNSNSLSLWN